MKCKDIASRNNYLLEKLAYDLQIKQDIEDLLEKYISIFTSYEEDRERLRIIAVKKNSSAEKKQKREVLVLIGKRTLKKFAINMETAKLKSELFCKLWQQVKNVNTIEDQEELIQNNINKLEEMTGESYL